MLDRGLSLLQMLGLQQKMDKKVTLSLFSYNFSKSLSVDIFHDYLVP